MIPARLTLAQAAFGPQVAADCVDYYRVRIPTNIAARIGEIESRFVTPEVRQSPGSSAAFASVLAASLGATAPEQATGEATLPVTVGSLISDASASRARALGRSADGLALGSGSIASKAEVKAIEGRYDSINGRLPVEDLTSFDGGHKLNELAANAFDQLRQAALADGVEIGVTDSYRSYDAQVDVARRKGLYSEGGLAAKPGTSDHGLGLALDLDLDSGGLAWMRANAGRFGFIADTPRESWHWKFDGV